MRREKLRDLMFKEEMDLTRQIMEEAEQTYDVRLEQMRAKTEELRKRRIEETKAVVTAKRMQQWMSSNQDVKQSLMKRTMIDVKRCNMMQMAENEARKLAEMQLDAMWQEVMLKDSEMKKREEEEVSMRRASAQRERLSVLAKQLAEKLMLEDEMKHRKKQEQEDLIRLTEDIRQTKLRELEEEHRKRQELRKELQEQMLQAKRYLVERARQEAAVDNMFKTLAEKEVAMEKARVETDIAAYRAELLIYLKYLEELRHEEIERDEKVDAIVRESHEEANRKHRIALEESKKARERDQQEVLRFRKAQMRAKVRMQEEEQRLKMEEKEAMDRQIEMNANLDALEQERIKQRTLRYKLDLEEQQRENEAARRREEEKEQQRIAEMKRREDEDQRLTNELMKASENIMPLPFKALLQECAARHAMDRDEECS